MDQVPIGLESCNEGAANKSAGSGESDVHLLHLVEIVAGYAAGITIPLMQAAVLLVLRFMPSPDMKR